MLKNIINCWINPKPKWKKEKTQTLTKIKYSRSTANKTQPNQTKKKNHSFLERQWMGTLSSGGGGGGGSATFFGGGKGKGNEITV